MLSTTDSIFTYAGNGVTTAFSFPRKVSSSSDIKVRLRAVADDAETTPSYSISGAGSSWTATLSSAPSSAYYVDVYRDPELVQEADLSEEGTPLEAANAALDRAYMCMQALQTSIAALEDRISRAQLHEISGADVADMRTALGLGDLADQDSVTSAQIDDLSSTIDVGVIPTFSDFEGSGNPGWRLHNTLVFCRDTSHHNDSNDVMFLRRANYSGGTGSVNVAAQVATDVAATSDSREWNLLTVMDTYQDGGALVDNTSIYCHAKKRHKNGAVWGMALDVDDFGGAQTGTYAQTVGAELTVRVTGAGPGRTNCHIAGESLDGAAASIAAAMKISPVDTGGTAYCVFDDGILFDGTRFGYLLRDSDGTFSVAKGGAAVVTDLTVGKNQAAATDATVSNTQAHASAIAKYVLTTDAGSLTLLLGSTLNGLGSGIASLGAPAAFAISSVGDLTLSRNGSLGITLGANTIDFNLPSKLKSYTVGTLPAAATAGAGAQAYVTDANGPTYNTNVASGGSVKIRVISDGSNWKT